MGESLRLGDGDSWALWPFSRTSSSGRITRLVKSLIKRLKISIDRRQTSLMGGSQVDLAEETVELTLICRQGLSKQEVLGLSDGSRPGRGGALVGTKARQCGQGARQLSDAGFTRHDGEGWRCWRAGPRGRTAPCRCYTVWWGAALTSSTLLLGRAQARTGPVRVAV